ncbi:G-protein alpha subunit-domain-containing protein [Mycena sp. CBHHK59/15]|nr:G-protein alpha subunit-domain-containing protein [Mycena sp. CBHHK59/15]
MQGGIWTFTFTLQVVTCVLTLCFSLAVVLLTTPLSPLSPLPPAPAAARPPLPAGNPASQRPLSALGARLGWGRPCPRKRALTRRGATPSTGRSTRTRSGTIEKECKILLLGSGESGKSTIVKQMKIIHQPGFCPTGRAEYRTIIYKNVLDSARTLVRVMRRVGVQALGGDAQGGAGVILAAFPPQVAPEDEGEAGGGDVDVGVDPTPFVRAAEAPTPAADVLAQTHAVLTPAFADAIWHVARDPVVERAVDEHTANFYLMDTSSPRSTASGCRRTSHPRALSPACVPLPAYLVSPLPRPAISPPFALPFLSSSALLSSSLPPPPAPPPPLSRLRPTHYAPIPLAAPVSCIRGPFLSHPTSSYSVPHAPHRPPPVPAFSAIMAGARPSLPSLPPFFLSMNAGIDAQPLPPSPSSFLSLFPLSSLR